VPNLRENLLTDDMPSIALLYDIFRAFYVYAFFYSADSCIKCKQKSVLA